MQQKISILLRKK